MKALPKIPRKHVADLRLHRLFPDKASLQTKADTPSMALIKHLGQLQIDPISVVARSEDLVMYSRLGKAGVEGLKRLRRNHQVFEYLTRAAMILPMSSYGLIRPAMDRRKGQFRREQAWVDEHPDYVDQLIELVKNSDGLISRDVKEERIHNGWGNHKHSKGVLEALCRQGILLVSKRRGSELVYEIAEPHWPVCEPITEEERVRGLFEMALRANGALPMNQMKNYYGLTYYGSVGWPNDQRLNNEDIKAMAERGDFAMIEVEGSKEPWFTRHEDVDRLIKGVDAHVPGVKFLSPFDPLIIDRSITSFLYDYNYKFEAYTPIPQRKYGAYTLPIIVDGRLIGRLDAKVYRKEGELRINGLWLEDGVKMGKGLKKRLDAALQRFAGFVGADTVITTTHRSDMK